MEEFKILKFMDRFKNLFEKFNIDYDVMRRILGVKFTMDNRRDAVMTGRNDSNDGKFKKMLILYAVIGVFNGIIMINPINSMTKMNLLFSIFLFMMLSIMIGEYSAVLLDLRDKNILFSKPVKPNTINAAKLMHIIIYMTSITLALSAASILGALAKHGFLFFIVFCIELLLLVVFCIFLTSILYYFILNIWDGEKIRDIVNYFQIIFTVVMMVGYQFMGNVFSIIASESVFTPKWWYYIVPPMWFSAPVAMIADKKINVYYTYLSLLGIVVPILLALIYFKFISPYFENKLQKMDRVENKKDHGRERKEKIKAVLLSIFLTRNKKENAFFRFSGNIMSKERTFKLRLYPSLAFAAVIPFIIINNQLIEAFKDKGTILGSIPSGREHLVMYVSTLMLSQCIFMIKNSESYKGAWIYKVLPIDNLSVTNKASLKSYILKYVIPIQFVISIIFIGICGWRIFLDVILIFLNSLFTIALVFKISNKDLPFSRKFKQSDSQATSILVLSLLIVGVLAAMHFAFYEFNYVPVFYIYIAISIIANITMWKKEFA